nr:MAG TPA: hypothetical protein [Bacteriophage sp.]
MRIISFQCALFCIPLCNTMILFNYSELRELNTYLLRT